MTAHYLLLTVITVLALTLSAMGDAKVGMGRAPFVIMSGSAVLLVMSLRASSVGTDTPGYRVQYEELYLRPEEPGYSALMVVSRVTGMNFQLFLMVVAAVVVLAVGSLIYIFSSAPYLSFVLHITMGFYAMSLSGLRQTLAVALTIFAFMALMKSKKVLFLLLALAAVLFHNSAIVFIPVLALAWINITRGKIYWLLAAGIGILITRSFYTLPLDRVDLGKYDVYVDLAPTTPNPLTIVVAAAIPLLAVLVTSKDSFAEERSEYAGAVPTFLVMACLNFLVMALSVHSFHLNRLSYYFVPYAALLLPNAVVNSPMRVVRELGPVLLIFCAVAYFVIVSTGSSLGIDNYIPYWEFE